MLKNTLNASEYKEISGLTLDQKRQLVQRVVSSAIFRRSPTLCSFLLYITDREILGRASELKEQTIGVEVMGRKSDYAPAIDNIVRVRAHELRGRLERYFASEGIDEPAILTIPVGTYVPEFVPRKFLPVKNQGTSSVAEAHLEEEETHLRWRWLSIGVIVLLVASIVLFRHGQKDRDSAAASPLSGAIRDFWGQFFEKPHEEIKIVYSDPSFALWQDLNGKTLNLGDYLNRKYLYDQNNKDFNVPLRRVTSSADLIITAHIANLAGEFDGQVDPRFARETTADFLRHGNVILLGSRRSNPWVESYELILNFQLGQDPVSHAPLFQNRSPKPNEANVYAMPAMFDRPGTDEREYTSYGVVAFLRGCGNRGITVLAEGLNAQATWSAGDMVTDPTHLESLLKSIGHKPGTKVESFEVLIQMKSVSDEYENPKVIAFRLHPVPFCLGD